MLFFIDDGEFPWAQNLGRKAREGGSREKGGREGEMGGKGKLGREEEKCMDGNCFQKERK